MQEKMWGTHRLSVLRGLLLSPVYSPSAPRMSGYSEEDRERIEPLREEGRVQARCLLSLRKPTYSTTNISNSSTRDTSTAKATGTLLSVSMRGPSAAGPTSSRTKNPCATNDSWTPWWKRRSQPGESWL